MGKLFRSSLCIQFASHVHHVCREYLDAETHASIHASVHGLKAIGH
jgi:hypothetical protein